MKIAIVGFGVEGMALFKYFYPKGNFEFSIRDEVVGVKERVEDAGVRTLLDLGNVEVIEGEEALKRLDGFEVIFKSPGIRKESLLAANVGFEKVVEGKISSTMDYFLANKKGKVVGVTGTKGKGTTSSLIYLMLKEKFGEKVFLGGNIGNSPLEFLDRLDDDCVTVLEMSSFQLMDLKRSPEVSVVLNVTSDHLDFHRDRDEYLEAKSPICKFQDENDLVIFNVDYPEVESRVVGLCRAEKVGVSMRRGLEAGAFLEKFDDGEWVLVRRSGQPAGSRIVRVDEVGLMGRYMLENVLAAVACAERFGVSAESMAKVIREFKGLPHRMELVREIGEMRFFNDSFSTGPMTSIAACSVFEEPISLIAGGSDKGLDFNEWAREIWRNDWVRCVVLIGDEASKMRKALDENNVRIGLAPLKVIMAGYDFEKAVICAYEELKGNGVVLLSPATASFDMFANYKVRGEKFREIVNNLWREGENLVVNS